MKKVTNLHCVGVDKIDICTSLIEQTMYIQTVYGIKMYICT